MANKIRGQVELQHGDQTYVMVLDFNALAEFEEEAGVENALAALANPGALNAAKTRALFWCGLRQMHPEMSKEEAGKILTANLDKLGDALAAAFPEAPAGNGGKPAPRARR